LYFLNLLNIVHAHNKEVGVHLGEGQQPAGALVVIAFHRLGVFRHLCPDESSSPVIIDNDCRDPNTVLQRHQWMCAVHNQPKKPELSAVSPKKIVRIDAFGGAVKLSPHCWGYMSEFFYGMMDEFADAIGILGARTIGLSSHGEHCALCHARHISVAQRIFLTVDAKQRVSQYLTPIFGQLGIYCTYHRRYTKGGLEFQKTRVIDDKHELFRTISLPKIMRLSDYDIVARLAPDLLHRSLVES
jgi:hypothetical protein